MTVLSAFLYAALALAVALAGVHPDPRTWGVHSYAFLPRSAWIASTLVLALCCVPAVAARAGALVLRAGALLSRSLLLPIAIAVLAAPCFYLGRLDAQFLGDGLVWVQALGEGRVFHHFEPLAAALTRWLAVGLAPASPGTAAGALSILLGPVYIVATALLCRLMWRQPGPRGACWLLLLLHPMLLFFFGYVESYPLLLVLQVGFVTALAAATLRQVPLFVPALVLGLAMAAHIAAVAWIPALVVFAWRRQSAPGRVAALHGSLAVALAVVVGAGTAGAVGSSPTDLMREVFGQTGLGGQSFTWFFSWRHGLDVVNEALLLLGPAFVLLAGALGMNRMGGGATGTPAAKTAKRRGATRGEGMGTTGGAGATGDAAAAALWYAIAALCAGTLAIALFVEPRIGGARDWDLFVPLVLPAVLLSVRVASQVPATTIGRALVLATVSSVGYLAVGVDAALSAARLEVLQDPHGSFSNFARGYANETLGIYYRNRNTEAARAAWSRAVQANPANPRYFNNLGMEELKRNDIAAACFAFRRTLELGMDEYATRFNVANCDRKEGKLEAAERHYDQLIARWPQRGEAFGARGMVRVQLRRPEVALQDLQMAARLGANDPEVFYSMGLALQALGRTDEARAAWERTLRLVPNHTAAREHLQALGAPAPPAPAP